jgi:hypothetical protein
MYKKQKEEGSGGQGVSSGCGRVAVVNRGPKDHALMQCWDAGLVPTASETLLLPIVDLSSKRFTKVYQQRLVDS